MAASDCASPPSLSHHPAKPPAGKGSGASLGGRRLAGGYALRTTFIHMQEQVYSMVRDTCIHLYTVAVMNMLLKTTRTIPSSVFRSFFTEVHVFDEL